MNKEVKEAFEIYFKGVDKEREKVEKDTNYKYSPSNCYKNGFKKFYDMIKSEYSSKYKCNILYTTSYNGQGRVKTLNPHIVIKKMIMNNAMEFIYICYFLVNLK